MSKWRLFLYIVSAGLVIGGLVALALYIRGQTPESQPTPSPKPKVTASARSIGNEKFGPRARAANAGNVDVGVRTVIPVDNTPQPSGSPRSVSQIMLAQYSSPPPSAPPGNSSQVGPGTAATATPPATPPPTPAPVATPPTFTPLAPPPAGQNKELVVVYAKGSVGKRQIYLRSIERDKDDQLVNSVFDDYGVALSSAAQKVAFYSNEEGPSDGSRARTKLKVVDLANGKVVPIADSLPGTWPAAWSSDGKKLAIPTSNGIFLADTTTGRSLQVPTGNKPGAIVWAPGNLKIYFQAETGVDRTDIFEADTITAQARPVTETPNSSERYPATSQNGQYLSFLRDQNPASPPPAASGRDQVASTRQGWVAVVRTLGTPEERVYAETSSTESYLWNLSFTELVFVKGTEQPHLSKLKNKEVQTINDLPDPTVVAWDRDYQHVFVLAADDQSKALFSVNINGGQVEKIKGGISDAVTQSAR